MPIKWSTLKVRGATDEIETYIEQLREPVASIKSAAELALEIPNIPEYIQQGFRSLISEAERVLGGVYSWNKEPYQGTFDRSVKRIRENIPQDALQRETTSAAHGSQQSLLD